MYQKSNRMNIITIKIRLDTAINKIGKAIYN